MKVHVHYRNDPELDEICDARLLNDTDEYLPGSLYITGEHFGAVVEGDQEGEDSRFGIWFEVIGCDARPGGKHTSPHINCVLR